MQLVSIEQAASLIGYSSAAINKKIERGVWREGAEFFRAPDGRIHIHIEGVHLWILTNYAVNIGTSASELREVLKSVDDLSESDSHTTVRGTAKRYQ